jgi:hypothetical protein
MHDPQATVDRATMNSGARLRGGLRAADPRHMPTLFTLIIAWWLASMAALVFLPYALHRGVDSQWTDTQRVFTWSVLCFVSTMHGALAYLLAHRRGAGPSVFFAGAIPGLALAWVFEWGGVAAVWGAIAFPLALFAVALFCRGRPEGDPKAPGAALRALDRLAFACGNIWFGILQIVAILVTISTATIYESYIGSADGAAAAHAKFYGASWFGGLCVLFFVTLYCATMRKWPFRISQAGWLCVHTGLLTLIIGCLAMFFGGYEGRMQILEGDTRQKSMSARERELHIAIPSADRIEKLLITVDRDPTVEDVSQKFEIKVKPEGGAADTLKVEITRALSNAEPYERLIDLGGRRRATEDGHGAHAGLEIKLDAGMQSMKTVLVEDHPQREGMNLGPLNAMIRRFANEEQLRGIGQRYAPQDRSRGTLTVLDPSGRETGRLPITVGARQADPMKGYAVETAPLRIDALDLSVQPVRFLAFAWKDRQGADIDVSSKTQNPDLAQMPGLLVDVTGPKGLEPYVVISTGDMKSLAAPGAAAHYGLALRYDCVPEIPLEGGTFLFAIGPGDQKSVIIMPKDGALRREPFEVGKAYGFSAGAPIRITPTRFVADADIEQGYEQTRRADSGQQALRIVASYKDKVATSWIFLGQPGTPLDLGPLQIEAQYAYRVLDFDFTLSLLDFRTLKYPNSNTPMAFETNAILRHPAKNIEEAILIDMNHPLDYGGYRFFNSSPIDDPSRSPRRGVVLQVTRNPGYATIIVACCIITIGLATVFFFKKYLRRWESRRAGLHAAKAAAARIDTRPIPQAQGA